jgi:hypothetical protein
MTTQDYERIARVFANLRRDLSPDPEGDIEFGIGCLQERLADAFKAENPRFQRDLFDRACTP